MNTTQAAIAAIVAAALRDAADEINDVEIHDWLNPTRAAAVYLRARADRVEAGLAP